MYFCRLADALHIFARNALAAVGYIFVNSAGKQPGILQYHCKRPSQRRACYLCYILAVYLYSPRIGVVKAHQKINNRSLSRTRMPDYGYNIAALRRKRKVVYYRLFRHVSEAEMLYLHISLYVFKLLSALCVCGLGSLFKHSERPFRRGERRLKFA